MEKTGIIKEIDNLGRLQIPKEIRTRLELAEKGRTCGGKGWVAYKKA